MTDAFKTRSMKHKNRKNLQLNPPPAKNAAPSAGDAQIPGALGNDEGRGDTLEIGVEFRLDLRAEDLIVLKELGSGNGGTVSKVQHAATKVIMARKVSLRREESRWISGLSAAGDPCRGQERGSETDRSRTENYARLQFRIHRCVLWRFPERRWRRYHVHGVHGCGVSRCSPSSHFTTRTDKFILSISSLDAISKTFGPVRVDVLGKIAEAVLGGLTYLYTKHKIMHRDLKPSNILVNSRGRIKLCDFGVSSELEGSVAETFVGTGTYMAPERIQGSPYTVKSDVWSVGLSLMELAIGKFPFNSDNADEPGGPQGILDLLQQIVLEPAPKLPKSDAFPSILEDMIGKCLMKNPKERPTPQDLYVSIAQPQILMTSNKLLGDRRLLTCG